MLSPSFDLAFGVDKRKEPVGVPAFVPQNARSMAAAALDTVNQLGDKLTSRLTVIQPGRVRAGTKA